MHRRNSKEKSLTPREARCFKETEVFCSLVFCSLYPSFRQRGTRTRFNIPPLSPPPPQMSDDNTYIQSHFYCITNTGMIRVVNYPQLLALQPADHDKSIQNRSTTLAIFAFFFLLTHLKNS